MEQKNIMSMQSGHNINWIRYSTRWTKEKGKGANFQQITP